MEHFITRYDVKCPAGATSAVLEDSIMHKGRLVTAGSKILENYVSPLDATIIKKLEEAGVIILGKTKMDEFGAAGLFKDSEFAIKDSEFRSGAVCAVADGTATYGFCNDYTGAVSHEAFMRGVCYVHPTYGTVSRFGLISAAISIDQIGIVCKTPSEGAHALSIIAGYDAKDGAMLKTQGDSRTQGDGSLVFDAPKTQGDGSPVFAVPTNVLAQISDTSAVAEFTENLNTIDFELKYFDTYAQIMQILCCAELNNNTTRYDGIKFGYRAPWYKNLHELYTKSRTEGFGMDMKLASLLGSMVLSQENYSQYYDKAMRIRRLIKESLEFDKYDVIVMPIGKRGGGSPALNKAGEEPACFTLALHALPRLCGLPAVTVPFNGGGITLIADVNCENVLFAALEAMGL